ncbi:hypothetical protein, variant 1 [Aphanomyces invadans]|uniref:SMP-30/Gluconolactonase/LRE-like region domain-containing protein n=1 Tax=Aphanomyces invadans TaxID=157072 RepID=A0A024U8N5_9STRA|nr:hypothetical protein, variant 1 [Aphanomyces invadans]ETW01938.1 hypothetical protein, variant 1 [Aphanomyces invadans]|eukprot:XP_008869786.1 hypothetical protein, variant 1 [Aphanomyces invadans]
MTSRHEAGRTRRRLPHVNVDAEYEGESLDTVHLLAGSGQRGCGDGRAVSASFNAPADLCYLGDDAGTLVLSDTQNNTLRFVVPPSHSSLNKYDSEPRVQSLRHARFSSPRGLAITASWDTLHLLVCDSGNHRIQWGQLPLHFPIDEMTFDTFAGTGVRGHQDGPANTATFHHPSGVCVDGNEVVYVVDTGNHCIREVRRVKRHVASSSTNNAGGGHHWVVLTIAGNGSGGTKKKSMGVVKDGRGRVSNHVGGYIDGPGDRARFRAPTGICLGRGQDELLVADTFNHCIRVVSRRQTRGATEWTVHTIAGGGQSGHLDSNCDSALFNQPVGICRASDDSLFVADKGNHCIRHIGGYIGKLKYSWVRTISVGALAPSWRFPKGVEPPLLLPKGVAMLPVHHSWYSPNQHPHEDNNRCPPKLVVGVCDTGNHIVRVITLNMDDTAIPSTKPVHDANAWTDAPIATPVYSLPTSPSMGNQHTEELERVRTTSHVPPAFVTGSMLACVVAGRQPSTST